MPGLVIPVIIMLILIAAALFLLFMFNGLHLGTFILVVFGGLFVISLYVDRYNKKRKLNPNFQDGTKNATESQRIYTETGIKHTNDSMGPGPHDF